MNDFISQQTPPFPEKDAVLNALRTGAQRALRIHKALGNSIVTYENGEIVIIPPEEIQIDPSIKLSSS
jgi:hypothetical protein